MRRPTQAPKRLLTPTEKQKIRAEIRECEMQLNSPDLIALGRWAPNPGFSAAHSGYVNPRLAMLKRRLEEGSVEDLSKSSVNKREKRIKELEERIKKRMVPHSFFHAKRQDSKDYNKTVDHLANIEMGSENQKEVAELKNLLRARSAAGSRMGNTTENPANASIEYLRENT